MFKVILKATVPMLKGITERLRITQLMIIIPLIPITTPILGSKVQFSQAIVTQLILCLSIHILLIHTQHTIQIHILPHHRIIITGVNRI